MMKNSLKLSWNIHLPQTWLLRPQLKITCVSWRWHEFSYLPCGVSCARLLHPAEKGPLFRYPQLCGRWGGRATNPFSGHPCPMQKDQTTIYILFWFLFLFLTTWWWCLCHCDKSPAPENHVISIVHVPTQANASAAQGNQHPALLDYATGWKKNNQSFKKNTEASSQHFSLILTPSLGFTLYYWKVKSGTPGVNVASLQVCDECGRPLHGTC